MQVPQRYLHHRGLRFVKPYFESHDLRAKVRHAGKTLSEAYAQEFWLPNGIARRMCHENHLRLLRPHDAAGTVHSSTNDPDAIVSVRDVIRAATMWTEVPVPEDAVLRVELVHGSQRMLVHKTSGLPVHENAHFRKNSMLHYLRHGLFAHRVDSGSANATPLPLRPLGRDVWLNHRIDRATSGMVMCSLTLQDVQFMTRMFESKKVVKSYMAKVRGRFGAGPAVDAAAGPDSSSVAIRRQTVSVQGNVTHCWAPLLELAENRGLWTATEPAHGVADAVARAGADGSPLVFWNHSTDDGLRLRETYSMFVPLQYDASRDETIVLCQPVSGKSRQLREHLKFLGHPIVGDEFDEEVVISHETGFNPFRMRWDALEGHGLDMSIGADQDGLPRDWAKAERLLVDAQLSLADQYLAKQHSICLHSYRFQHPQFFSYTSEMPQWAQGAVSQEDIDLAAAEMTAQRPDVKKAPKKKPTGLTSTPGTVLQQASVPDLVLGHGDDDASG